MTLTNTSENFQKLIQLEVRKNKIKIGLKFAAKLIFVLSNIVLTVRSVQINISI